MRKLKMVNLKQAILQAWKERWSDYQWAVNIKKNCPKGATWDYPNLAEALLEQAMIGPSPNPLILSYLKYAISSQMVSYSSVLTAVSKFDDFSRELCVKSLLEIMDMFSNRLSCHGKAEECIALCRALLGAVVWLLQGCAWYCERLKEQSSISQNGVPQSDASLRACQERLENLLQRAKNRALMHIARLEEQASWSNMEQALIKLTENLGGLSNPTLKSKLDECVMLVKSVPQMLSVQCEPPVQTAFPSVHAFIMLEGTMNLTGEMQPLVEQLMLIKRIQRIPAPLFVLEIWKACFTGLIESPEGTEELKWTAFTFLKIPQVLLKLKKYPQGDKDFMEEVNVAFEYLLKLTPLLDKADQRCNSEDREYAPKLKTAENANIQPNPGLILRAEPTVTNILKVILSEPSQSSETPFFETWLQMCMPEEGKILNPDHPCFRPEPGKVESLVALLNTSSEMKLVVVIMSSILEHMCADVFQQTGQCIRSVVETQELLPYRTLLPLRQPIRQALSSNFRMALNKGWVDSSTLHLLDNLLHIGGVFWFTNNLVKELLKETRKEWAFRVVELLYSIFCLDLQQITLTLIGHIVPNLLTDPAHWHSLADPPGRALANSYSSHHKIHALARQRKRQREDIEDYSSLFPLDDTQPSKLMRLLSSNEDEPTVLSSPGETEQLPPNGSPFG
ncbi:Mediator of RNA polymerase II transcription subunit 24 [Bagarius yarrelli]|uniref:Mediator of RNA polymerase II transcription subunit 24 n=1 Tax=Bagarius yarrelli TaxID=175774 RepID=A0A556VVP8_BAGYA|nr:Mediator of RNA polymerase II transcription subunit 24 [Bagarius yarrelli]